MTRLTVTIAAIASAACAASVSAATPPQGGTIAIEPRTLSGDYDPSLAAFVSAAGETLAAQGFTIFEDAGHAAYVAELVIDRTDVGTGLAKGTTDPVAALPGGAGSSVGAGVVIPFSTGKSRLVPLRRTRLEVRIHRRGQSELLWKGTAMTVRAAGTKNGADDVVATDLNQALLRSYPAEPADVVGVP